MTTISSLPWVDRHPSTWRVLPLYGLASEVDERNSGNSEQRVLSLSYGRIIKRDVERNLGLLPASFETSNIVQPGDVVMRLTDLQNDKRSLRTGLVTRSGIITSAYTTIRFNRQIDPRFGHYYLHALDVWKVFYGLGGGVRQSMKFADIRRLPMLVPPADIQTRIADFLDRETTRIDALVDKKRRLIEMLEEKRTATITQAVTKGLDPTVPTKDSSVEWIGEIPKHWTVRRTRYVSRLVTGKTPPTSQEHYYENGTFPWFGPSSLGPQFEAGEPVKNIHPSAVRDGVANLIPAGSTLLVCIGGSIGRSGYTARQGTTNQQITALEPTGVVNGRYLAWIAKAFVPALLAAAPQTTMPIVSNQALGDIKVPVPPQDEQAKIDSVLSRQDELIADAVSALDSQIKLIRELRQATVTAGVTGSLDTPGSTDSTEWESLVL